MFMVMKPRERFFDARNISLISAYDSGNDPKPMQQDDKLSKKNKRTG